MSPPPSLSRHARAGSYDSRHPSYVQLTHPPSHLAASFGTFNSDSSSFSQLRQSTPMDAFPMAAIPDIEEIVDVPEDFESGGGTTGVYCVVA